MCIMLRKCALHEEEQKASGYTILAVNHYPFIEPGLSVFATSNE